MLSTGAGIYSVQAHIQCRHRHTFCTGTGIYSVQGAYSVQTQAHIHYRHRHIFSTGTGIYSVQAQAYILYRHIFSTDTGTYSVQTQAYIQYRYRYIFSTSLQVFCVCHALWRSSSYSWITGQQTKITLFHAKRNQRPKWNRPYISSWKFKPEHIKTQSEYVKAQWKLTDMHETLLGRDSPLHVT